MLAAPTTQFTAAVAGGLLSSVELEQHCADCLRTFDPSTVRKNFPILQSKVHGKLPLVYLDNAATTQKPQAVIARLKQYYDAENANVHRGVYELSQIATEVYEEARATLAKFVNARKTREIVFTRGTTESINLVANSFGRQFIKSGDEILVSGMEHHSNIVPWQMLCQATGAALKVIPFNDKCDLDIGALEQLFGPRTKMVAVTHLSNVLGTINPVEQICQMAHAVGAKVLVDGAQWVGHFPTDVQKIGCDFYALSGHKMFGPTGIGVLYGREELLEAMPPYQGGGDMISSVTFEKSTWNELPWKFEAGTPNMAGAVGLAAAVDYLASVNFPELFYYEHGLLRYMEAALRQVPGLRIIGEPSNKSSVVSFVLEGVHPHDIGTLLDGDGVCIRTGHHCCQPVMDKLDLPATARASLAFYNSTDEVNALVESLHKVVAMFR